MNDERHIVFVVGTPSKLVSYSESAIPGCFIHPVPHGQERKVILGLKVKYNSLLNGLQELQHYINYLNQTVEIRDIHQTVIELSYTVLQTLKLMKSRRESLRILAIDATNKLTIIEFKVHRIVCYISNCINRSEIEMPPFPLITL